MLSTSERLKYLSVYQIASEIKKTNRKFADSFRYDMVHRTYVEDDGFRTGALSENTKALWRYRLELEKEKRARLLPRYPQP